MRLFSALFAFLVVAATAELWTELATDDECSRQDGEHCTLEALQLQSQSLSGAVSAGPHIVFMRHGESESNLGSYYGQGATKKLPGFKKCKNDLDRDAKLSGLGKQQARIAASSNRAFFAQVADPAGPFQGRIYCSYLRRATQTAAVLAVTLSTIYPGTTFQIIPIPYIQESDGGCDKSSCNEQGKWDRKDDKIISDWGVQNVQNNIKEAVGNLPENVVLNATFVFPPSMVNSSWVSDKKLSVLIDRVRTFYAFGEEHGLFRSGAMLAVSHGRFIRSVSCLLHESEEIAADNCFLAKSAKNCAIFDYQYTPGMRLTNVATKYSGNFRAERSRVFRHDTASSFYPQPSGQQNWTMSDLDGRLHVPTYLWFRLGSLTYRRYPCSDA
eukprot:TRINITY_DN18806_c0_g1_i2.p1 TRINITY_DN18806_c0_g1~~TRINITY_DN18806_c0_g1_i2.p1  ORF type:complete len:384 (+),score=49.54 TRINITY_DN18806_c0_g1_i2:97-1248(+)